MTKHQFESGSRQARQRRGGNAERIYVYKCVVDDGGAPCIDSGLRTLTICKPYIRSTAIERDLIFAFGSNTELPANRLVDIAEVSRTVRGGKYFEGDEFKQRQDCIYERVNGRLQLRSDAGFHTDEKARETAQSATLEQNRPIQKQTPLSPRIFDILEKTVKPNGNRMLQNFGSW